MSHELRTPLNSLLILSKLLAENPDANLTDKQIEFASTIHTAGADLLSLISDILDLSKVEAGKMDDQPGPGRARAVCAYVERAFGPVAEQKGLAFEITTAHDTPPTIFTDEQRVQQVLRNLLSNAFKFTEAGEVALELAGTDERAEDGTPYALAITVRDSGIGIAEDKLRLIFEAFQQADGTTSRRYGGTGLGLSISREIMRMLGGEIRVRSARPARAARSSCCCRPTSSRPCRARRAQTARLEPGRRARARARGRAAEADAERGSPPPHDDRALRARRRPRRARHRRRPGARPRARSTQAREHGFRGVVAPRGNVGLSLAHELVPDVIVLAVPVRGGAGVLEQLKHHPRTRHVPVHVIADAGDRHGALSAGAAGFLERPADAEALAGAFAAAADVPRPPGAPAARRRRRRGRADERHRARRRRRRRRGDGRRRQRGGARRDRAARASTASCSTSSCRR